MSVPQPRLDPNLVTLSTEVIVTVLDNLRVAGATEAEIVQIVLTGVRKEKVRRALR